MINDNMFCTASKKLKARDGSVEEKLQFFWKYDEKHTYATSIYLFYSNFLLISQFGGAKNLKNDTCLCFKMEFIF
jgi:hypothetical protein